MCKALGGVGVGVKPIRAHESILSSQLLRGSIKKGEASCATPEPPGKVSGELRYPRHRSHKHPMWAPTAAPGRHPGRSASFEAR